MSAHAELTKVAVQEFARRFRQESVPIDNTFSYFAALPLGEEERKEFLEEPVAALPPAVHAELGKVAIVLVPYLEKPSGKGPELVSFEKPQPKHQVWAAQFVSENEAVLVIAIKDQEAADYHYVLYRALATVLTDHVDSPLPRKYYDLLREELRAGVHGEVDEGGWELKQSLVRKQSDAYRDTKMFRAYARQSLIDTLTLYLHGICCDIDVESGPRQLPSRSIRRRLQLLHELMPPPSGYAVFPDELK
jgi:hypothetical protein